MTQRARISILVFGVLALGAALCATAQASTVHGTADTIVFEGTGEEKNVVDVYKLGDEMVVNEEGRKLSVTPSGTCKRHPSYPDATQVAVCPIPYGTANQPDVVINTGEGKDFVHVYTYSTLSIDLGAGTDRLIAYDNVGPASIGGGDGNDRLTGSGRDPFSGAGFDDTIVPGEGSDKVAWGLPDEFGLNGTDSIDLSEVKAKSDKVQCVGGDELITSTERRDKFRYCL